MQIKLQKTKDDYLFDKQSLTFDNTKDMKTKIKQKPNSTCLDC